MIDPTTMNMRHWSDAVALDLDRYGPVWRLDDEENWRPWAEYMVSLPGISAQEPPVPSAYQSFREWAQEFAATVDLIN